MAGKKNMFGGFNAAAQQRKEQQEKIEATVTGRPAPGSPATVQDKTTITLSITREDKARLKSWAAVHGITMSDLLHDWITRTCTEGEDRI